MNSYNIESITKIIISHLQKQVKNGSKYTVSNVTDAWHFLVNEELIKQVLQVKDLSNEVKGLFVDTCWYLALQGIIRPSTIYPYTITGGTWGANGMNFSITESGKEWLEKHTGEYFIFTTAVQYTELIKPFSSNFEEAFMIRSKEAASCYQSCNYYATCAMAGAATESIILSIGAKKLGSEEEVKKSYRNAGGRKNLLKKIMDGLYKDLKDSFDNYTGMLTYWRNESAHASNNNITKFDALNSLEKLLNFSRLVHTKWDSFSKT